jgi:hypothetical protein
MRLGTILYLSLLVLALLHTHGGGWLAQGMEAIADQTRPASPRRRFA